ncbi:hypothetical protein ISN45_Aa04g029970, partial [Arabidopsis thaliana x Arabidopsis arenosa]
LRFSIRNRNLCFSSILFKVLQHECRFKVAVEFMEALGLKKQCSCVMFFNMNVR